MDAIWDGKLRSYSCLRIEESSRGTVRSWQSYISDIVIYSDSWEEHLRTFKRVV